MCELINVVLSVMSTLLLMVMLKTCVVRRRLTDEDGFFLESRARSASDVRLVSSLLVLRFQ